MIDFEELLKISPYSRGENEKSQLLTEGLKRLTQHHYSNCIEYRQIFDRLKIDPLDIPSPDKVPFLPIRLFKEYDLYSVPQSDIFKKLTSSGTTGNKVSKIFLDKETANRQSVVLTKILNDFFQIKKRIPMLVIDSKDVFKNRNMFSARGAAIIGFSMLGKDLMFALDESMKLDLSVIKNFCEKHKDGPFILFGFTSIIWENYYKELLKIEDLNGKDYFQNAIMIHGGGWKKLADQEISNEEFKRKLALDCGINSVYNYYGMVEQTGSIFMECEFGHFHSSIFSEIFFRRPKDFSLCDLGERGIVQLVSLLPTSYPGHSILTEDIGEKIGVDDCKCGRYGSYFLIHGRIENAEIRGCSDAIN